ncbi:XRE family transcriptional regulator [Salibacterium salarium]|uniref:XRE family transcriptional regulator n=1 Tax=Salibacterium salarium TaxID=284579 RepID=A0A428MSH0_9BACI|nr:helix-turn-helix transcriptional regulator [Salibacterium salarium]RSL29055.1 XRE family transcriptional regulator [Salibacterium salarium]
MFGLGRPRSKFGKFMEREGITQEELAKASRVTQATISRICSDKTYMPKISTVKKLEKGFDKLDVDFDEEDFFG